MASDPSPAGSPAPVGVGHRSPVTREAEAHEPADAARGLSEAEVADRIAVGATNATEEGTTRPLRQILRANVLTRFNAILGSLFVVVMFVGPPQDALFGVVLAVNTVIGVAQELRAKRTLDALALLAAPSAHAIRDGRPVELSPERVVLDDLLEVRPGDQAVADGLLLAATGLEVDESLITGEAEPVVKSVGEELLSGSVVVAGTGRVRVVRVGPEAFAQRMQGEGRRFSLVRSELQQGTNQILRMVTWVMVPTAALLVASEITRAGQSLDEALRGSVAGVAAMVPEGLVLLTTIAFALGAVRLAGRRVLVQELAAIEGLARVDVVCVDKTGTLTEPGISLAQLELLDDLPAGDALGAMVAADPAPNATALAMAHLPAPPGWEVEHRVPFSSSRKWSAVSFSRQGTWVLGAPEVLLPAMGPDLTDRVAVHTGSGQRVLLVAHSPSPLGEALPGPLAPAALAVLEERVRPTAPDTVRYLLAQGVRLIVLSGDDPATVGAVARRVGVPGSEDPRDARTLPQEPEALAETLQEHSVFGRVQPHQKQAVVAALQGSGHVVAMTGDGVNDVPALKAADLGMAMGSGSPATRAVGRLVLLDSTFAVLPDILGEGRRVIANVERVARLFVTKTVYAAILAVVVGLVAVPYPFYPRHLTVVSSLTIGIPGFFLALVPGAPLARPGFVRRVLRFTVPAGSVAATATLAAYLLARGPCHATDPQARTVATFVLLAIGLEVLAMTATPLNTVRLLLIAAMAAGGFLVWLVPLGRRVFGLATPPLDALLVMAGVLAVALPVLAAAVRLAGTTDPGPPGATPSVGSRARR